MANETTLATGVTKREVQGTGIYNYYFPDALIVADTNNNTYSVSQILDLANQITVSYSDITDKLGAADIEEYCDILASSGYYSAPPSVGIDSRVIVKQSNIATTLGGTIDPNKEYYIDGVIDMGTTQVTVPAGGINITGGNFGISRLESAENTYTMFISDVGGSGDVFFDNIAVSVSGTTSQVFDLEGATGDEAIEMRNVNFNNCTSLGEVNGYRQGLESNTGRFGGTPSLTLSGAWAGGYAIATSIARGISNAMTAALYKAGTAFVMASRFRSNQNLDLGTLAPFFDFAPSNFTNPSTVQLDGCIITRNGISDATDTTIIPNMVASDLVARWRNNEGITNTFEGGRNTISSETATTIAATSTFYTIAGTWTASELQHFDSPASGQLRHLGNNPRAYKLDMRLVAVSTANNELEIRVRVYDSSAATTSTIASQIRVVDSLVGARDVAYFDLISYINLDQDDYVFLEIANNTGTNNVTAELDSFFLVSLR